MASALSPRLDRALACASRLHAGQLRKGTAIPYISHLLAVTAIVLEHGGEEDEVIAALLHDAVEDQGGRATREAIRERFGEGVVAIVDGCDRLILSRSVEAIVRENPVDLPPENWSSENESPHGWDNAPRRTACVGAGLRRNRSLAS
jgi:(p)ppGpp synthase/HD superfamily hydrolase